MVIVGVQQGGKTVSSVTVDSLQNALSSVENRIAPTPPGADVVPPGRTGGEDGPEIYLALGDSLAANVGAARPQDGYVSRFHSYLERQTGRTLGLLNLGVSGESSISITKRQLPDALAEIERRKNDGDPNTRVSFLTIDLGPNDLLSHLGSEDCQRILRDEACNARADAAVEAFEENFSQIVASLASALEPGAEFYIMTMYNPFNFGIGIPFETFTNGVAQRMNAVIRAIAEAQGATISDPFDLMNGHAASWTHMLSGDIHPNAKGYQALAFSLAQAEQR